MACASLWTIRGLWTCHPGDSPSVCPQGLDNPPGCPHAHSLGYHDGRHHPLDGGGGYMSVPKIPPPSRPEGLPRIAVLVSGNGSNLQALIDATPP